MDAGRSKCERAMRLLGLSFSDDADAGTLANLLFLHFCDKKGWSVDAADAGQGLSSMQVI